MIRDCSNGSQRWLLLRESMSEDNLGYNTCYQIPISQYGGDLKVVTEYDDTSTDEVTSVYTLLSCICERGYMLFSHYRYTCGDSFVTRYEGIYQYQINSSYAKAVEAFADLWEIGKEVYSG